MIRRTGETPQPGQSYTPRPGVYAILPLQRRFLMTLEMAQDTEVQLPGGGIEVGESPLQALHREVLEETGWRIARPRRLGAFRRFTYMKDYDLWAQKFCHIYVAHPVRQIAAPTEPHHATLVLSASEALATLANEGDRLFLQRHLR
ncbi:NUDIX domain-containing protein [Sulfitobacter sp. D7]|uniref:NUDIX domain-containing protein n=1 Tax=Sulfitobacter sp. D7 TaxID=1968541 RepID=UPI000E7742AD|nr:NUDIX hydrolase [Sulfitobacter sp. D7]AYE84694.1 NUDIX hydrolase [Sulfitobacter sp. D7]